MQMIAAAAVLSLSPTVLNDVCQARCITLADRHTDKPFHCCQTKDINLGGTKRGVMIIDTTGFF